jgi:hypothetical protein
MANRSVAPEFSLVDLVDQSICPFIYLRPLAGGDRRRSPKAQRPPDVSTVTAMDTDHKERFYML